MPSWRTCESWRRSPRETEPPVDEHLQRRRHVERGRRSADPELEEGRSGAPARAVRPLPDRPGPAHAPERIPRSGPARHPQRHRAGEFRLADVERRPGRADARTQPHAAGRCRTLCESQQPGRPRRSVGDRILGRPGAVNALAVRKALDLLKTLDARVPSENNFETGSNTTYRVSAFASVRLLEYRINGNARITVRFLGFDECGAPEQRPPVASDGAAETPEETPKEVTLSATEPDAEPLTNSDVASPAHESHGNHGEPRHQHARARLTRPRNEHDQSQRQRRARTSRRTD